MPAGLSWRSVTFAGGLAGIAGFVDAAGYLHLGGYFISFMSGNSTRASADLVHGSPLGALLALGLVTFFVVGVMIGAFVTRRAPENERTLALTVSSVLLVTATVAGTWSPTAVAAPPILAAALGAMNTSHTRHGEVSVGLTYMTGTLVKIGQHLVRALTGERGTAWPRLLLLWTMITLGALAGAVSYQLLGLGCLWIASGLLATAAGVSAGRDRRPTAPAPSTATRSGR